MTTHKLITREQASLRPPAKDLGGFTPEGVCIHHGGVFCRAVADPTQVVRNVQNYHMNPVSLGGRGYSDIEYGFLIVPTTDDGAAVIEGRGVDRVVISNGNAELNRRYGSVCIVGDYRMPNGAYPTNRLTPALIDAVNFALALYVARYPAMSVLIGHNEARLSVGMKGTACPGSQVLAAMAAGSISLTLPPATDPTPAPAPDTPPGLPAGVFLPTLTVGWRDPEGMRDTGPCWVVQRWLNARGYPLKVDGYFGPLTSAAVFQWQDDCSRFFDGKPYDGPEAGIVGPETWIALATISEAVGVPL